MDYQGKEGNGKTQSDLGRVSTIVAWMLHGCFQEASYDDVLLLLFLLHARTCSSPNSSLMYLPLAKKYALCLLFRRAIHFVEIK